MANQWLRLWHDMPTDPKWRTIARVSGRSISEVVAVYLHALVAASNATERGRTHSFNCEDVASALDLEVANVEAILAAMQGRVIDGDVLTGWEKRQPLREDGSAERAKQWRERKRTQTNANERQDTDKDKDKKEQEPRAGEDAKEPTAAGLACKEIMRAGIMANPSHPDLLAAIAEGTTTAEFRDAAIECKRKGKGFAYLLAMVRRRKADAAAPVKAKAEPKPSCHLPAAIERTTPEEREARRKAGEENIKKIEAMLPAMRVNA